MKTEQLPIASPASPSRSTVSTAPASFGSAPGVSRDDAVATLALLGVPIDSITADQALDRIDAMIASRKSHCVVTPNVDILVQAAADRELHRILLEADLVLADGAPLIWLSRLLRCPLPERVAGSDLVPRLLRRAEKRGYRVFLLGGRQDIGQKALEKIRQDYPGLTSVDQYSPPFADLLQMDHEHIRNRIRDARPDLLLVCFGCPKQEKWIAMNHRLLGVPVCMGVGATIDFLAGHVSRAPRWMRHAGLEWLFRLSLEPRRLFYRYWNDLLVFVPAAARQLWRLNWSQRRGRQTTRSRSATSVAAPIILRMTNRLDAEAVRNEQISREMTRAYCTRMIVDLSRVSYIDSSGIGALIKWRNQLAREGKLLVLMAPTSAVKDILDLMQLTDFFLIAEDVGRARSVLPGRFRSHDSSVVVSSDAPLTYVTEWNGELTAAECDRIWDSFERGFATRPAHVRRVEIDLSGVNFIDSSGVGLLLRAQRQAAEAGVHLSCRHAREPVLNVLDVTNTLDLLVHS